MKYILECGYLSYFKEIYCLKTKHERNISENVCSCNCNIWKDNVTH